MSIATGVRWWVAPPRPGETLASLVQRAAELYHCSPEALWQALGPGDVAALGPTDAPSTEGLRRLGQVLDLPPKALVRARLSDATWRLAPAARQAICPRCMEEDLASSAVTAYRADWTRVLTPVCSRHRVGLRLMRAYARSWAGEVAGGNTDRLTEREQAVLTLIGVFGEALEGALFFGRSWPAQWRGTPAQARTWLLRAALPSGDEQEMVASRLVAPAGALAAWIHGPRNALSPVRGDAWAAFRAIADPAQRRASLWIAAWLTIPDLPDDLSPGWDDWAALTTRPARWERPRRERAQPALSTP